jgi:hypothetical protein
VLFAAAWVVYAGGLHKKVRDRLREEWGAPSMGFLVTEMEKRSWAEAGLPAD